MSKQKKTKLTREQLTWKIHEESQARQKELVKGQVQGCVYALNDGNWKLVGSTFTNTEKGDMSCWCTGCEGYDELREVSPDCKNIRNLHCLWCACKWCVCDARRAGGLHDAYCKTQDWDSICTYSGGCPSCDITWERGDSLSNIYIQNHGDYPLHIEHADQEYRKSSQQYDSCVPVQMVNKLGKSIISHEELSQQLSSAFLI